MPHLGRAVFMETSYKANLLDLIGVITSHCKPPFVRRALVLTADSIKAAYPRSLTPAADFRRSTP